LIPSYLPPTVKLIAIAVKSLFAFKNIIATNIVIAARLHLKLWNIKHLLSLVLSAAILHRINPT